MELRTLEIGAKLNVDGHGICQVKKLAFDGSLSKHYFVITKFGDRIRICWNPMLQEWTEYSQH